MADTDVCQAERQAFDEAMVAAEVANGLVLIRLDQLMARMYPFGPEIVPASVSEHAPSQQTITLTREDCERRDAMVAAVRCVVNAQDSMWVAKDLIRKAGA